jgi:diguanylate cyclase (GGDEF)-like protein
MASAQQLMEQEQLQPDVVMLDLNLPDSTGVDTVRRCRMLTDAPLVVLTGLAEESAVTEMAIQAGADDYLVKGGDGLGLRKAMWRDLAEKGHWYGEMWNRRKNGVVYAEMITISAVCDARGQVRQYVGLFSEVTMQKKHERQLEHLAHYDALTHLPNRVLLGDRLRQAMAQAARHGYLLAVVYIDLDGFKAVNDTYSHELGDQLLMTVANRMNMALRDGDTIARLGGDEFVAVLCDLPDTGASVNIFNRLLDAAAQPVQINNIELRVSASLGVTFFPQADEVDADQLLRQADQSMYQAKLAGKNCYHIFDAEQDRSVRGFNESVERIRRALQDQEFQLYYQPKVNMRSGQVIGTEALIRWQHPDRGLLLPALFLPVVEDHPLSVELGEWVIETALIQLERWREVGLDISISINVGGLHLQQQDFMERLCGLLAAHPDARPERLELEVLESCALADIEQISRIMRACREMGIHFSLDDFGTGYSSLTYLRSLPAAQLKIDQSFVRDMLDDPENLAILEGVLGLATAFRRTVVAEGVETVEHGRMLLQLGCELAQGFCIARPMPAWQVPDWVAAWKPDSRWTCQHPVKREDLPCIFANVELRAWVRAREVFLKGEAMTPPSMDSHSCRLGSWLDSIRATPFASQPGFARVDGLHRQLHRLGNELLDLRLSGHTSQSVERLDELFALRDELADCLTQWIEPWPKPGWSAAESGVIRRCDVLGFLVGLNIGGRGLIGNRQRRVPVFR